MSSPALVIIAAIATWFVCGRHAASILDRHYRQRGDQFYDKHQLAIAEADTCVFLLGPIGWLGVYLLLRSD